MEAFNNDAEVSVLGSTLLTNGKALDDLALTGEEFYAPKHEAVYRLMLKMWNEGQSVDVITLVADARFMATKATADEAHQWTSWTPTSANVEYYADIVMQLHVRRSLHFTALQISEMAKTAEFETLTETARSAIDKSLGLAKSPVVFVAHEIDETILNLDKPSEALPTPWLGLNSAIGGWRKGALYIIGARPGRGKTSIGIQAALELAKHGSVAMSSLEMRREEIHKRIASMTTSIPMDALMNHKMTKGDWEKWALLRSQVRPMIAIDDRAEVTIHDIRTHARTVAREMPLQAIIVDYLQLMTSKDNRPRHEIVAEFSRQLKIMARDLNVPVIALSQLNRSAEGRIDKKPSLGDLRESGAIEQDADVVILLHIEDDGEIMTLDVAKNRHGAQAVVRLRWEGQYARAV